MKKITNGFTPGCHPELGSGSSRSAGGFTLIEVLVVILIIGILAAVALPQYKHAVLKSRFSTVMPTAKAVADANELLYLDKGYYASNDEQDALDISSSPETVITLATHAQEEQYNYVAASRSDMPNVRYIIYQQHSPKFAGQVHCEAAIEDEGALWLCEKGLHGTILEGIGDSLQGSEYKTYLLFGEMDENSTFMRSPLECEYGYYDDGTDCVAMRIETSSRYCSSSSGFCAHTIYRRQYSECQGDTSDACVGSIFEGGSTRCKASKDYACMNSVFTGDASDCSSSTTTGCINSTFIGKNSSCSENTESIGSCSGSTFYPGSHCLSTTPGGCADVEYVQEKDDNGNVIDSGCCMDLFQAGNCPAGSPRCYNNGTFARDCWDGNGKHSADYCS